MANILGLHFGHDGSACVVQGNNLTAAIGAERVTHNKKNWGMTEDTIDYALRAAGLTIEEIDLIAASDYHENFTRGTAEAFDKGQHVEHCWQNIFDNEVWELEFHIRGRTLPGYHIGHHMAHCASAFYTSPFEESYCFSMDASGGKLKANSLIALGRGNKLEAVDCPGLMAGCCYGFFCEQLGLGAQILKAGTMMGLAAYGEVKQQPIRYVDAAFHSVESEYHAWMAELWRVLAGGRGPFNHEESDSREAMNIAATMQAIFEQCILRAIMGVGGGAVENLCLTGGSLLNCNANTAVLNKSRFKRVHLFPACSDDGLSVGTALYVAHHILNEPRRRYTDAETCYLGEDRKAKEPDVEMLAKEIADGKVVAWFQGRSEYGPRALGNRSILADPRSPTMRAHLNENIKCREWFRPFGPSVLEEKAIEWFDFTGRSPFMLFTAPVKRPGQVPAITHVDGTTRMQTVRRESNPRFYRLIEAFEAQTGVPMVLNTSLNGPGEPILETEEDAMRFWERVPVDLMVLNGKVLRR